MNLWEEYQTKALNLYKAVKGLDKGAKASVVLWSSTLTTGEELKRLDKDTYVIQYWGSTEDEGHREQV